MAFPARHWLPISNDRPDLFVAIGGGGFFPARVMRTFLKAPGQKNISIQAIGLSLYEELGQGSEEKLGKEVIKTQWLDFSTLGSRPLLGRRILIVVELPESAFGKKGNKNLTALHCSGWSRRYPYDTRLCRRGIAGRSGKTGMYFTFPLLYSICYTSTEKC